MGIYATRDPAEFNASHYAVMNKCIEREREESALLNESQYLFQFYLVLRGNFF